MWIVENHISCVYKKTIQTSHRKKNNKEKMDWLRNYSRKKEKIYIRKEGKYRSFKIVSVV